METVGTQHNRRDKDVDRGTMISAALMNVLGDSLAISYGL
jgi:hypothetical protein